MVGVGDRVFLTGATGFLGSHILSRILRHHAGSKVFVLVRPSGQQSARDRVERLLGRALGPGEPERYADRLEVVQGDISEAGLGIDPTVGASLRASVDQIIHCAAAVRWDLSLEDARRDNVLGTHNVLEFAGDARSLGRLDYVGTAFVAGERDGLILEDELDVGQTFRNTYEQTKMEAEQAVRSFAESHATAIYRPSVVVGDSKTGAMSSFQGASQIFLFYRQFFSRGMAVPVPVDLASRLDIIPIDYVIDALFALMHTEPSLWGTFHLASGPGNVLSFDEMFDEIAKLTGLKRPSTIPLETYYKSVQPLLRSTLKGWALETMLKAEKYIPYASSKLVFDKTRTDAGLRGSGVVTPHPRSYLDKQVQFQEQTLRHG